MKKFNLNELKFLLPAVDMQEQRSFVGGGSGTSSDPYSRMEYLNMVSNGTWVGGYVEGFQFYVGKNETISWYGSGSDSNPYSMDTFLNWYGYWPGGYVDGLGYVHSDINIYGNSRIVSTYSGYAGFFDMVENVGSHSTYSYKIHTIIYNGTLSIIGNVRAFDPSAGYDYFCGAEVYQDGVLVARYLGDKSGPSISPDEPNYNYTGCIDINLTKYHGHVVVIVRTYGMIDTGTGHSGIGGYTGAETVYDRYR